MKLLFCTILAGVLCANAYSQARTITEKEFGKVYLTASNATSAHYPYTLVRLETDLLDGVVTRTRHVTYERQAAFLDRTTTVIVKDNSRRTIYKIMLKVGKFYCSNDGITWSKRQPWRCNDGSVSVDSFGSFGTWNHSISDGTLEGKNVKILNSHYEFHGGNEFSDSATTIDENGLIVSEDSTFGTLNPRKATGTVHQKWDFTTKFLPIKTPK